jgi:hypothetical protein
METYSEGKYYYIDSNATTQVVTGACTLVRIIINTAAAGSISIIDNTAGSTVNVGIIKASAAEGSYEYGIKMAAGIRIITAHADSDITVVYRQ